MNYCAYCYNPIRYRARKDGTTKPPAKLCEYCDNLGGEPQRRHPNVPPGIPTARNSSRFISMRCSYCERVYPKDDRYAECPSCREPTRLSINDPMSEDQAAWEDKTARFGWWLMDEALNKSAGVG